MECLHQSAVVHLRWTGTVATQPFKLCTRWVSLYEYNSYIYIHTSLSFLRAWSSSSHLIVSLKKWFCSPLVCPQLWLTGWQIRIMIMFVNLLSWVGLPLSFIFWLGTLVPFENIYIWLRWIKVNKRLSMWLLLYDSNWNPSPCQNEDNL